jgi:hypothetical protein
MSLIMAIIPGLSALSNMKDITNMALALLKLSLTLVNAHWSSKLFQRDSTNQGRISK